MCVYFQIKLSINGSFSKPKEILEEAKHISHIAEEKFPSKNEEPQTNSLVNVDSRQAWER